MWSGLLAKWVTASSIKPPRVRLRAWRKPDYAPSWDGKEGRWIVKKPNKKQPNNAKTWDPVAAHWIIRKPCGKAPGGKRWCSRHGAWMHPLPEGRKPKSKVWDEVEGEWVAADASSAPKAKRAKVATKSKVREFIFSLCYMTEYLSLI